MKKITKDEWIKEGERLFGKDRNKWKFKCPACGHIQTMDDFNEIGVEGKLAIQECIGRHTGKGAAKIGDNNGCDWAAYGLFGTLDKGVIVIDDKNNFEIFDFAEGTD